MTIKDYLREPALRGEMKIVGIFRGERLVVRTERTWFHPQGGGQKADQGVIGPAEVYNVKHAPDGEVDHFVASLEGIDLGGVYPFAIDADGRRLNANHHTAGHLIAALGEELVPGVTAINGHHWPGEARVEFRGEAVDRLADGVDELERRLVAAIKDALPVRLVGDPFIDRRIQIGDFPAIPCGGTHAEVLSQLGAVALRGVKVKGGIARIGYDVVAG
jgi:alanyl-tRNA synthetase